MYKSVFILAAILIFPALIFCQSAGKVIFNIFPEDAVVLVDGKVEASRGTVAYYPVGKHQVRVDHPDWHPATSVFTISYDSTTVVEIRLTQKDNSEQLEAIKKGKIERAFIWTGVGVNTLAHGIGLWQLRRDYVDGESQLPVLQAEYNAALTIPEFEIARQNYDEQVKALRKIERKAIYLSTSMVLVNGVLIYFATRSNRKINRLMSEGTGFLYDPQMNSIAFSFKYTF